MQLIHLKILAWCTNCDRCQTADRTDHVYNYTRLTREKCLK